MYNKILFAIPLGLFICCNSSSEQEKQLYGELKKEHEYYLEAQNRIDSNVKKTEQEMLVVKDKLKNELGYFSVQYHQFDESLTQYLTVLEDKASKHKELIFQQAVLEDEMLEKKVDLEEAVEKEKNIKRKRETVEKDFNSALSMQDSLMHKAQALIEEKS